MLEEGHRILMADPLLRFHGVWQERRDRERAVKGNGYKLVVTHILLISYSQSLFSIVMLCKIATNTELGNTETLLIGKIGG